MRCTRGRRLVPELPSLRKARTALGHFERAARTQSTLLIKLEVIDNPTLLR